MRSKLLYPLGFIFCLLAFLHYSCQKEVNVDLSAPGNPSVVQNVTTNISGRVLDENKLPVEGAVVKAGSVNTTTDVNGDFEFSKLLLDKNAAFVKVEKAGYFLGSRTLVAKENSNSYVEIELIPKKISGTFDAAQGGTVTIANGGAIQFSASSIINTTNNTAYTGTVSVAAYFINPEASNFSAIMPGDLRGITTANEERALQSFGMMVVELTGASGEKLNLSTGKSATLTFPIPSSLVAKAAATIPLWYFDETKGLWKEEGAATKQGSNYVGSVAHFSFWNCDAPFPLVNFEATIQQQNGAALPYARVVIRMTGDSAATSGSGYTDSSGKISGKIPANKNLQLVVYSPCGALIYSQSLAPLTANTNLGTINVTNATSSIIFNGDVIDCNNAPLANGFVNIVLGGRNYHITVLNGKFSAAMTICSNVTEALLTAIDSVTNQQSAPTTLPIVPGGIANPSLKVCGTSDAQFINYTFNGSDYSLTAPADSLRAIKNQSNDTDIEGMNSNTGSSQNIYLYFNGATTGVFPLGYLNLDLNNRSYSLQDSSTVTITEYGNVNGFITGNFVATLRDSATSYPINGNFRVRRSQ